MMSVDKYFEESGLTKTYLTTIYQRVKQGEQCNNILNDPPLLLGKTKNGLVCEIFRLFKSGGTNAACNLLCVLFGEKLTSDQIKVTGTKIMRLFMMKNREKRSQLKNYIFSFPEWRKDENDNIEGQVSKHRQSKFA